MPASVGARLAVAALVASIVVAHGALVAAPARSVPSGPAGPPAGPTSAASSGGGELRYAPPVDAPVIDPFRPAPHPYGAGNRGLTYGVAPLTPVRAIGDGDVVFAGVVGGSLHVTVRHPDGLRSSYSFLAAIAVSGGATVRRGDLVGWSGEVLHLGVRTPDGTYLDPELLWSGAWVPRLVPGGDDGTTPGRGREPAALLDLVRERRGPLAAWVASAGASLTGWSAPTLEVFDRRLRLWMHVAGELDPATHARRALETLDRWWAGRRGCTPPEVSPAPPVERRIVVEVGGIGSTSDAAAIDRLDVATLGYEPGDVVRFSYAGGRVPPPERAGPDPFAGVMTTDYDAVASQADLDGSGRRLAALLDQVARAAPGVPIDVVAHSQGGVVARLALDHADATSTLPPDVATLVTLGSPHEGADLATAIEAVRTDPAAAAALDRVRARLGVELDPALPAAGELSEVSPVIERLRTRPVPPGVRFTSVAARGDVVVTAGRTAAPGAARATVPLSGTSAHDRLPGSPEATREVLLAIGGHGPTCVTLADALLDAAVGDGLGVLEDATAATALGIGVVVPGSAPGASAGELAGAGERP